MRPVAVEKTDLLITSEKYAGKTPAAARAEIKKILDCMTFGVAPQPISYARASALVQLTDDINTDVVVHGVCWVKGNVDGTDNTGKIYYGKPVVFDTTTAKHVTGINAKWSSDEYKVIGLSLANISTGTALIPVMMGVNSPTEKFSVLAKCRTQSGVHPSVNSWSQAGLSEHNQRTVWEFELPKAVEFKEDQSSHWFGDVSDIEETRWEGSGSFIRAFNLDRSFVRKNAICLLHNSGKSGRLQFYFNYATEFDIYGTLLADLIGGGNASIQIDGDFAGGLGPDQTLRVYESGMMPSNRQLSAGTRVLARAMRYTNSDSEDGDDPFIWRMFVVQANSCSVPVPVTP